MWHFSDRRQQLVLPVGFAAHQPPAGKWSTVKWKHFEGWSQDCSKSDGSFSQYLISSPWRRYEDLVQNFFLQTMEIEVPLLVWATAPKFALFTKGSKLPLNKGFKNLFALLQSCAQHSICPPWQQSISFWCRPLSKRKKNDCNRGAPTEGVLIPPKFKTWYTTGNKKR